MVWSTLKKGFDTAANVGTLGLYGTTMDTATMAGPKATTVAPNAASYEFGGSPLMRDRYRQELSGRDAQALAMAGGEAGAAQQARGLQGDLYGQYGAMARGEGPSLAAMQMRAGLDQAQQQAGQQAASVRGGAGNQLIAQRMAQQTGAALASQAAQATSELRQREQLAAMEAQAGLAGAMRQGDLASRGLSEQRAAGALGARMGLESQQMQGQMAMDEGRRADFMAAQGLNLKADAERRQRRQDFYAKAAEGGAKAGGLTV